MKDVLKLNEDNMIMLSNAFNSYEINKDLKVTSNQKVRDEVDKENVKEFVEKLQKDPHSRRALLYLDLVPWVESKIQKKSIRAVIQKSL
mgnify:CR=1 FL=1